MKERRDTVVKTFNASNAADDKDRRGKCDANVAFPCEIPKIDTVINAILCMKIQRSILNRGIGSGSKGKRLESHCHSHGSTEHH